MVKGRIKSALQPIAIAGARVRSRFSSADIAMFHEFVPPPYGGGNQFLRALWKTLESRGWRLENNAISPATRACLYNSFNFDFDRLHAFRRAGCRMVHRVDGPVAVYRGRDDGTDRRIWEINGQLADVTVFQSEYSRSKHADMGLVFKDASVIHNAADPEIFHSSGRAPFDRSRKIKLIATSWSDNANKGADVLAWLESRLDPGRFELTFVGRSPVPFARATVLPPLDSRGVAEQLRAHDIFFTASLHESCSNALIEALSCGLPALFVDSGSNAELVKDGGVAFTSRDHLEARLDQLVAEYEMRQSRIAAPRLEDVADRYLSVMGLPSRPQAA
ncbi:MAG: glycosyltransferase family 4 protein [Cyanobacteria bacterium]|nr:glycosyltransferase family 4 protein [Cyanobacteriota bacterium]